MSCIEPIGKITVMSGTFDSGTVRTVTLNTVTLQNVIVNLISTYHLNQVLSSL